MKAEVLYFDGCPNWVEAAERIRAAAALVGIADIDICHRPIDTDAQAAATPFAGSPTILIDGVDAFDDAVLVDHLACRMYATDAGLAGVPTVGQLADAFRARLGVS